MHRRPAGAPARRCRASRKWLQRPMHEAYEAAWALAPRRIEDPRPGHAGDCPGQPSGSSRRQRAPAARANGGRGGRPRRTRRTATAHLVTCAQARAERVSHRARADGSVPARAQMWVERGMPDAKGLPPVGSRDTSSATSRRRHPAEGERLPTAAAARHRTSSTARSPRPAHRHAAGPLAADGTRQTMTAATARECGRANKPVHR
jgi:hypothetical protein